MDPRPVMYNEFRPYDPKALLRQLSEQCLIDSRAWFPSSSQNIVHHSLALCGEVGEVANIVKKIDRGDFNLSDKAVYNHLRDELGDVFIYLLNLAGLLSLDLLEQYKQTRQKNVDRWGSNGRESVG
jgi:NTP pyrophosphatase (non-canonical NTP hydrolase)